MSVPTSLLVLQANQSANANGTSVIMTGSSWASLEVIESNGGTATITVEGSYDGGANWYAIGVQRIDGQATVTRAASISVTANLKSVWQILDFYPQLRARTSSVATSPVINVRAYLVGT